MDLLSLGRHLNQLDNNIRYHMDGDVLRFSAPIGPQVKVHGEVRQHQGKLLPKWGGQELGSDSDSGSAPKVAAVELLARMAPYGIPDSRSQYMVRMQRALVNLGVDASIEGDRMHVSGSYRGEDWDRILVWKNGSVFGSPMGYLSSLSGSRFMEDFGGSPAQAAWGLVHRMQEVVRDILADRNRDPRSDSWGDWYARNR